MQRIMKYIILLLLSLVAVELVTAPDEFEREDGVVVLGGGNFQLALEQFDNILVQFYQPWCSDCKTLAIDYVKVAATLEKGGVVCAKLEAPGEEELVRRYGVVDFPTFILYRKDNQPRTYQGNHNDGALVEWVTHEIAASTHQTSALQAQPGPHEKSNAQNIFIENSDAHLFNRQCLPLIKSIISMDYFRYVKINLNKSCELWCNNDKCNLRDCQVKTISDPEQCPISSYDDSNELATVNTDLDTDQLDLLTNLFECHDNDDHDAQYVDLLLNPERYTGYSGESAHRIWRAIYEENCFASDTRSPFDQDMCYEERLFYEAISGLHTSINIHLCAEYPSNAMIGSFEPNLPEFLRRFEQHNDYIQNLYKLYFIELKALARSKPYLTRRVTWPDQSTKNAVDGLLKLVEKFHIPMNQDFSLKPSHVSHQLALHFRNITTTIIDCVACDKCKLWGKIQLRGLGTAFKVLSVKDMSKIHLNHQEISSLVNALARLSQSIRNLEEFSDLYRKGKEHKNLYSLGANGDSLVANNDYKSHVDFFNKL